jgi:hypothetical protein
MTRTLILLAATILTVAPAAAQPPTDFTGTWTMDESRSASATHDGFVGPVTWIIRQAPDTMTVAITRGPKQNTISFRLLTAKPATPETTSFPSFRGYWEGDKLVTETAQNIQGQTVTTREVRTLLNGGREMLVERVVQVEHGYTMKGAQSYNTSKDYFRRVAP